MEVLELDGRAILSGRWLLRLDDGGEDIPVMILCAFSGLVEVVRGIECSDDEVSARYTLTVATYGWPHRD